ncbi:5-oxoprolinase subunit PxpB [Cognatiluteimonas profundi]|uniref:5-oxoprolinase subunit PxpB n=1 Tax=Cognatiluteimonas profundi TaxID=2594501 RepID=UPI00131CEC9B|nr:5-oxoprolinase subunit PxpB [Lysobacter profundi]
MAIVERATADQLPAIDRLGEDALLLRFGDAIDASTNARVHALSRQIARIRPAWLLDIVPAYATLALFLDIDAHPDLDMQADAIGWLRRQAFVESSSDEGRLVRIPVRYGGDDGPDLADVAAHAGMTVADVVALHASGRYTVAMLGFAPGFPYLLGLDKTLAMPRLATPRLHVQAGSVGIGGEQAGIYPRSGPGGWRIIGRTSKLLFDPAREPPALLAPGDRVEFVSAADP